MKVRTFISCFIIALHAMCFFFRSSVNEDTFDSKYNFKLRMKRLFVAIKRGGERGGGIDRNNIKKIHEIYFCQ